MIHVILTDTHHHDHRQFGNGEGAENSRFRLTIKQVDEIREFCIARGITSVIHGGDVFEARRAAQYPIFNETLDCYRRFKVGGIHLKVLKGNHDEVDRAGKSLTIHAFRSFAEIKSHNSVEGKFAFVPFTHDTNSVRDFLKSLSDDLIILGHWDVLGAEAGATGWEVTRGLNRSDLQRFRLVLLGHIHKRQSLGERVHYIGATNARNFEERDQAGWFCTLDDESGEVQWHETSAPIFRLIKGDPQGPSELWKNTFVKVIADPSGQTDEILRASGALSWIYSPEVRKHHVVQRDVGMSLGTPLPEVVKHYSAVYSGTLDKEKCEQVGLELLEE